MYMKGTSRMFIYFTCNLIYEHTRYCCLSSGTHILVQIIARLWLNIHHIPQMMKVVVHTQYHYMSKFKIVTFCNTQHVTMVRDHNEKKTHHIMSKMVLLSFTTFMWLLQDFPNIFEMVCQHFMANVSTLGDSYRIRQFLYLVS